MQVKTVENECYALDMFMKELKSCQRGAFFQALY